MRLEVNLPRCTATCFASPQGHVCRLFAARDARLERPLVHLPQLPQAGEGWEVADLLRAAGHCAMPAGEAPLFEHGCPWPCCPTDLLCWPLLTTVAVRLAHPGRDSCGMPGRELGRRQWMLPLRDCSHPPDRVKWRPNNKPTISIIGYPVRRPTLHVSWRSCRMTRQEWQGRGQPGS